MNSVQKFYEVRKDEKVIPEGMTIEERHALGWDISKVVQAHWTNTETNKTVSLKSPFGIFSEIVQGRRLVAALIYTDDSNCKLVVFLANGSEHLTVSNLQRLSGHDEPGQFAWFTTPHEPADDVFGVVFQADDSSVGQYWLDIDARSGRVLACTWTK
jgi:hypothetical protein